MSINGKKTKHIQIFSRVVGSGPAFIFAELHVKYPMELVVEIMEHIAELSGIVTGFHVTEQYIDCMCGKDLLKIDKNSRDMICQRTVFEKEGLSRKLIADDEHIYNI